MPTSKIDAQKEFQCASRARSCTDIFTWIYNLRKNKEILKKKKDTTKKERRWWEIPLFLSVQENGEKTTKAEKTQFFVLAVVSAVLAVCLGPLWGVFHDFQVLAPKLRFGGISSGFYLGSVWVLPGFGLGSAWVRSGFYLGSFGFYLDSAWFFVFNAFFNAPNAFSNMFVVFWQKIIEKHSRGQ